MHAPAHRRAQLLTIVHLLLYTSANKPGRAVPWASLEHRSAKCLLDERAEDNIDAYRGIAVRRLGRRADCGPRRRHYPRRYRPGPRPRTRLGHPYAARPVVTRETALAAHWFRHARHAGGKRRAQHGG